MQEYAEQLQELAKDGMYYHGVKKEFKGKGDETEFFCSSWSNFINSFGYYYDVKNVDWIMFVTDTQKGILEIQKEFDYKDEAIEYLIQFAENHNFAHYSNTVMDNFNQVESSVIEYLQREYKYSKEKAKETIKYLLQVRNIAFEFYHFILTGNFLPEKFACTFSEYIAKRFFEEMHLTPLESFNYMIYLDQNPTEALANFQTGLPSKNVSLGVTKKSRKIHINPDDITIIINKHEEKIKLEITDADVARILQIYDDVEINAVLKEISELIEEGKLENNKEKILKCLRELKIELFGIDRPVKCIDHVWRKHRIIGYCYNLTHSGYLTSELMEKHECLQKQCPFFKEIKKLK